MEISINYAEEVKESIQNHVVTMSNLLLLEGQLEVLHTDTYIPAPT
jgi:hypothetical protein